jgi:hypothetical protein
MIGLRTGWRAADMRDAEGRPAGWSLPYTPDHRPLVAAMTAALGPDGPGFTVVTGLPVDAAAPEDCADTALALLREIGTPLLQGPPADRTLKWLVRYEGVRRFRADGAFQGGVYTSKSRDGIEIHNDSAMQPYGYEIDISTLLCVESAPRGGATTLVSTPAVMAELRRDFPEQFARLCRPFVFERTHVTPPGGATLIPLPVFSLPGESETPFRAHWNRQRIEMGAAESGKPLTPADVAALDALDEVLSRPALRLDHVLRPGELLVLDDHRVLHGRAEFTDGEGPAPEAPGRGRRRCLVRILLSREPAAAPPGARRGSE